MQRPLGLTEDNALVILMTAHKLNYTPLEINIKSLFIIEKSNSVIM